MREEEPDRLGAGDGRAGVPAGEGVAEGAPGAAEPPRRDPRGEDGREPGGRLALKGLAPLVLLAVFVVLFLRYGPLGVFRASFPPVEELTVERIALPEPGLIRVHVVNGGPEPVTIAQAQVDEAYWEHSVDPDRRLGRLERAVVEIPYPWVEGDPHEIRLVTSNGVTFDAEIPVATESPSPDARYLTTFALLGVYVGVIPVFLGLLWLPFLRGIPGRWLDFFLSLTMGLLLFLGIDALAEALEVAEGVAPAFQGIGLVLIGVVGTPLLLASLGKAKGGAAAGGPGSAPGALRVAYLIALGIGLHNLGEGLAIGAAYSTGEIALGTTLVLGFLLHNTTEGLGIVAPIAEEGAGLGRLAALGAIAGLPTIAGAWIGGFSYSPLATVLFFAIGAGAIVQVLIELWKLLRQRPERGLVTPLNAGGLLAGLFVMYLTGLLVAA